MRQMLRFWNVANSLVYWVADEAVRLMINEVGQELGTGT